MKNYALMAILLMMVTMETESSRILVYPYGHCLNSHLLNFEKLIRILQTSGHSVSMVISTAYDGYVHKTESTDNNTSLTGVTMLQFPTPPNYKPVCEYDTMEFMLNAPLKDRFHALIDTSVRYCDALLSNKALMRRLKASNFELLILESLDPCAKIIADYLDIPFVPLMTAGLGHWDGNPRPASYLPAAISPYTSDMSFFQRLGNVIMKNMYEFIPVLMGFDAPFEQLKVKYGLNVTLRMSDTFDRAALKLVNSDFAIDYPAPIEPDTVMVGGFAVDDGPAPPLSRELEDFMQSSGEHGVIVMSFGTLTKRFEPAWTKMFVDALSKLPQKIVWRYYPSNESDVPELFNSTIRDKFMLMKWLPQSTLLRHPKTKLFISHCGLNGMFETTHYGVPVLAVPLSGDHFQNAAKLTEYLEMGVTVDIFSATSDSLYTSLTDVINDGRYRLNARRVSDRVHDQPISAATKLNYWVDYVIRHRGAPHLKSRAHKLTWIQYHCLDVICFIGALLFAIFSTVAFIILKLLSRLFRIVANEILLPSTHKTKMA